MSYLLDERIIRVLAGASLIFKAPKEQWMKIFEPLKGLAEPCHSGLVETMVTTHFGLHLYTVLVYKLSTLSHHYINMYMLSL